MRITTAPQRSHPIQLNVLLNLWLAKHEAISINSTPQTELWQLFISVVHQLSVVAMSHIPNTVSCCYAKCGTLWYVHDHIRYKNFRNESKGKQHRAKNICVDSFRVYYKHKCCSYCRGLFTFHCWKNGFLSKALDFWTQPCATTKIDRNYYEFWVQISMTLKQQWY